jgi:L-ribulose-5-phosphate 4-epimerase
MLEELKRRVCEANLRLVTEGLVLQTWGNVSGVDRASGHVVIKPSGVSYDGMKPDQMVVLSLETGQVVEGRLNPSSDTPTHLVLYRAFPGVGGIVHTHSLYATAWAQARREIPPLGTTHADHFRGPVPCTRPMTSKEIRGEYEVNTGKVIVERLARVDALACPAVLVASHGPFTWGRTADDAVDHAVVLEFLARLAGETYRVSPRARPMPRVLLDKHFLRKHGPGAYYGQSGPAGPGGRKS